MPVNFHGSRRKRMNIQEAVQKAAEEDKMK